MVKIVITAVVLAVLVGVFVIYRKQIFGAFGEAGDGIQDFFGGAAQGVQDFFGGFNSNSGSSSDSGINPDPSLQSDEEQQELFGKTLSPDEELVINFNDNPDTLSAIDKERAQEIIDQQLDDDPQFDDVTKFNPPGTIGFGYNEFFDGKGAPDTPFNRQLLSDFLDSQKTQDTQPNLAPDLIPSEPSTIEDGSSDIFDGVVIPNPLDLLNPVPDAFGESVPASSKAVQREIDVTSDIKGQQFGGGGLSFTGGTVRESEQDAATIRSRNQESDAIKEARRLAGESRDRAIAELDRKNQQSQSRDAELMRRAEEANRKSQGQFFGKTPEEIALELTGGSISKF